MTPLSPIQTSHKITQLPDYLNYNLNIPTLLSHQQQPTIPSTLLSKQQLQQHLLHCYLTTTINNNTTHLNNMPSSKTQSWFARHCTPAAPIMGTAPVCPCADCFNGSAMPPRPRVHSTPSTGADSDSVSLSSCRTYTSSTHVEETRPQ